MALNAGEPHEVLDFGRSHCHRGGIPRFRVHVHDAYIEAFLGDGTLPELWCELLFEGSGSRSPGFPFGDPEARHPPRRDASWQA